MGVIFRQSLKGSIVSYIGIIIGAINLIFLMPVILNPEEIGLIRTIIDSSFLLSAYAKIGIPNTAIKFFPYFKDQKKYLGILGIILVMLCIGILLTSLTVIIFKENILANFSEKSPLVVDYFYHIIILTILYTLISGISIYSNLLLRITVPKIIVEVFMRLAITIPIIFYYYELIHFSYVIPITTILFCIGFLFLLSYIAFLGKLFLKFNLVSIDRKLMKSMGTYIGFMILGSGGAIIVAKIDTLMISSLKGLSDTAVYSIAFFMAVLVEIPRRSLSSISLPILARYFKDDFIGGIDEIYKKSSANLLLIGGISFLLIWLNIDSIFLLIPNSELYAQGKYVVLFIALAKVIDMGMGTNTEIIANSNFYRWNVVIMPFFAIAVIVSNLIFIPIYGINGAAIASLISICVYNIIRFLLVKIKLNMQPFSFNTLKIIFILSISYLLGAFSIYTSEYALVNIIITSLQIIIPFIILILFLKPSEDLDKVIKRYLW